MYTVGSGFSWRSTRIRLYWRVRSETVFDQAPDPDPITIKPDPHIWYHMDYFSSVSLLKETKIYGYMMISLLEPWGTPFDPTYGSCFRDCVMSFINDTMANSSELILLKEYKWYNLFPLSAEFFQFSRSFTTLTFSYSK